MLPKYLPWWPQAEADGDDAQGSGDPTSKKRFVEDKVQERYKPRDVREYLARYNNNAETALEHAIAQNNEIVERLMRQNAEKEYELAAAQSTLKAKDETIKTIEGERDTLRQTIEAIEGDKRRAKAEDLLKNRIGDETLVRRTRAYLKLDGYDIEVDGEGDKAKLMLVSGDRRHNFDTVVNDAFYAKYPDAKPQGDDPLPTGQLPTGGQPQSKQSFGEEAAKFYSEAEKKRRESSVGFLGQKG